MFLRDKDVSILVNSPKIIFEMGLDLESEKRILNKRKIENDKHPQNHTWKLFLLG